MIASGLYKLGVLVQKPVQFGGSTRGQKQLPTQGGIDQWCQRAHPVADLALAVVEESARDFLQGIAFEIEGDVTQLTVYGKR